MLLIDSHLHVDYGGLSSAGIISYLDNNKIDCCWLLSWEEIAPGRHNYQHLSIENLYDTYLKYPSRIIPMYAPDPHRSDAVEQLRFWHRKGIKGCAELKTTLHWDCVEIKRMLSAVSELDIPVVFHMEESGYRIYPKSSSVFDRALCSMLRTTRKAAQLPQRILKSLVDNCYPLKNRIGTYHFPGYLLDFASLKAALSDHPKVRFVAHGPLFWKHISADAAVREETYPTGPVTGEGIIWRLFREYPNLYADISASGFRALTRDPQNAKKFLSLFSDKILYGTDNEMFKQRDFLDSLRLSKTVYRRIYGLNANGLIKR